MYGSDIKINFLKTWQKFMLLIPKVKEIPPMIKIISILFNEKHWEQNIT